MTFTNHVMTGALIAVSVHRPALAIPLAIMSHYATDALPHYGYGHIDRSDRDKKDNFILKQSVDAYTALAVLWTVPFLVRSHQAPIVTVLCMLSAFLPDTVWTFQYLVAQRGGGSYKELGIINRFHKKIQWCERPWGIYVEVLWFLLMATSIRLVVMP